MLMKKEGHFLSMLPKNINLVHPCPALECYATSPKNISFYFKIGIKWWIKKIIRWQIAKRDKEYSPLQKLWKIWSKDITSINKHYDIAIAYIDEAPTYYVIEKVLANKKIIWNHCDYNLLHHVPSFDEYYYMLADNIVTISDECKKRIIEFFPIINPQKIIVLNNISNGYLIHELSKEYQNDEMFNSTKGFKILSVGRLSEAKNYKLALKAAYILKQKISFTWFIIGEGPLRNELEKLRNKLGLNNVYFIGIRMNPYYYMKHVDCMVMSSLTEGKSIAVDEAKIMQLPIVSTNYPTINDNLTNNFNGIITEMTPESLSEGIYTILTNSSLRKKIKDNLSKDYNGNIEEIKKYIDLFTQQY